MGIRVRVDRKMMLQKMKTSLLNLVVVIHEISQKLPQAKDQDVVLAIGSTGCGKSTMLNAILWGPESLSVQKIDVELRDRGGNTRIY